MPIVLQKIGLVALVIIAAALPGFARGAAPQVGPDPALYQKTVSGAINFLRARGQNQDGSFSGVTGPGITALVTTGILKNGRPPEDPTVAASLKYLESFVQPSGGIHKPGTRYRNYETCLSMVCFAAANRDGRYDKLLKSAEKFVKGIQWDGEEGHDLSSESYGGAGYGSHKRPDLSNTNFLIDALKANGAGKDDEALKKALIFVSRCQNLETEHNTTKFAAKNPDGGFYYTPAAGGTSQAGETDDGGLRSYGSMTYAGLKSMIFAGVDKNDPRVKAAFKWVQRNYNLEQNPGMGKAGLYYYYHTFAKALDAMGVDQVEDGEGVKHDWRRELAEELARNQKDDGSWTNENTRWLEGDPNLVTGYALLTLSYCRPRPAKPAESK